MSGPVFGPAFWQSSENRASSADVPDAGTDDPPNPSAYLADPPPGGMLTETPEPEHLIYAAFAGLLIGGLVRTMRGGNSLPGGSDAEKS